MLSSWFREKKWKSLRIWKETLRIFSEIFFSENYKPIWGPQLPTL